VRPRGAQACGTCLTRTGCPSADKASSQRPPSRLQLYDLRIYIKAATNHTIAKTQIPWWDVPIEELAAPAPAGDPEAAAEAGPGGDDSGLSGPASGERSGGGGAALCDEGDAAQAQASAASPTAAGTPKGNASALPRTTMGQGLAGFAAEAPAGEDGGGEHEAACGAGSAAAAGGGKPLLAKQLALDVADLALPRVAPGGVSFSIPAHRPGEGAADAAAEADDAEAADAASQGALTAAHKDDGSAGAASPHAPGAPAAAAAGGVGAQEARREDGPTLARSSAGSIGSGHVDSERDSSGASSGGDTSSSEDGDTKLLPAAAACKPVVAAALATHAATAPPSPSPSFSSPRRQRSVLSYAPGSAYELSRRLRSILAPAAREVSRMGWAPMRGAGRGRAEDDGGRGAAGARGAGKGPAVDAWGGAWKVRQ
jgi:hypothetical protein